MEDTVALEGEKVKVMNGVKEDKKEVKLQNGDSEKAQINGDIEKMDDSEVSEDHNVTDDNMDNSNDHEEQSESESKHVSSNSESENNKSSDENECNDKVKDSDKEAAKSESVNDVAQSESVEESKESDSDTKNEKKSEEESMEVDSSDSASKGKEEGKVDKEAQQSEKKEKKSDKSDDDKEEKMDASEDAENKKETSKESDDKSSDVKENEENKENSTNSKEVSKKEGVKQSGSNEPVVKGKKNKKDKSEEVQEILPPRQLRVRRTPRKYTDDDDDIKIEKEVVKDDSDIEMIEESDPLALSDADVRKAQAQQKEKEKKEMQMKSKDSNVIIIDTSTLLKNQGNLAAVVAQSHSTSVNTVPASPSVATASVATGTSTVSTNMSPNPSITSVSSVNIQTAIQAITGGVPAQGLQSAYITALQQVLLAQGGQVPMNSQHLAQLQQYYNSLGHLQDDAYVIEAPSFIVPYVMEGKPKEPIKTFLKRINKDLAEYEKEEEKKKKEQTEKKEKEKGEAENKDKVKEKSEDCTPKEEEKKKDDDKKEEKTKEEGDEKEETKMDVDEDKSSKKDEEEEGKEKDDIKDKEKDDIKDKEKDDIKDKEKDDVKEKEKDDVKDKDSKEKEKESQTQGDVEKDSDSDIKVIGEKSADEDKENKEKKEADVVDLENEEKKEEDLSFLGKWEPYYRSTLGKFILDLGLNQAQEFLQSDLLRMQKKKIEKMKTTPSKEGIINIKILEKQLERSRKKNAHLRVPLKTCKFCNFKTESEMVMDRHLESPHMVNYTYKCNFCEFETRGPQVILFHMEAEHNIRGRLERAPAFFQCSLCPYEDNNKSKMTRHSFSCSKKYKPEKNCELADWEPPAKIPKIHRGRPNTLGKAFEPVKMPNLLPKGLTGFNLQSAVAANLLTSSNSAAMTAAGRGRGRPVGSYKTTGQIINQGRGTGSMLYSARGVTTTPGGNLVQQVGGNTQQFTLGNQMFHSTGRVPRILPSSSASNVSLIPGLAASSSITIQSVQNKAGNTKSPQQPSISITPLPRGGQQPQNISKGNTPTRDASGKPSFVICEICDGYIKDLEQLRNHMNLIHKVKIHPKMIYNRPPLNCQKCQHRFFTDQGLERHLLGTHGLVTSSMQEAANKGKDAGRCPICGKVFQWKLLNHVSRDHKMTLKPAHLSYKCTVCTATFNMYRLFENHVYSAHSVVNKNKGDVNKKQGTGGSASDPPLKINDEITIIPQPAAKSSKADNAVSSSKKSGNSPTVSKEITITKVGSRPTRRSGNSVEVISLDESPKKVDSSNKRASKESAGNSAKKAKASS